MKHLLVFLVLIVGFGQGVFSQKSTNTLALETDNTSMVFSYAKDGKFLFQYYGPRLDDPGLITKTGAGLNEEAYTTFGVYCEEEKALSVKHSDGNLSADLYFKNLEVKELDENVSLTKVSLYDKEYPFFVDLYYKVYSKEDIIEAWTTIRHEEKKPVLLKKFASFSMSVKPHDPWLTHFHGHWSDEFNVSEEPLTHGVKSVRNREGVRNARHDNASFMLSLNGKSTEKKGDVIGLSIAWTGTYQFSLNYNERHKIEILAGMNEDGSDYILPKNEVFTTPKAVLTYSSNGKGQVSRNFHRWARNYQIIDGNVERPILLNSWEGIYFDITEEAMVGMINDIADMGGELFVMDDGWFGDKYPRNNAKTSLGDWMIDKRKLPNGLTPLLDASKERGIEFGIWLEPEMINVVSELYEKHPDWVIQQPNREIVKGRGGGQMLLDLSNPEVQDFIFNTFDDLLQEYPEIGYIKWDANHFLSNIGSNYLSKDKQSHLYIEYHRGLQSVFERIRTKYPDLLMQACASGGGRVNYGFTPYFHEFWTSDVTDALTRVKIQWGTSFFFPAIVQGAHVSAAENHQTGRVLPLKFRCDVAMSGRFGLELQPKDLNPDEIVATKTAVETYKSIRPVIQLGDLYRLVDPYENKGYTSLMYVSDDKNRAVVFFYNLEPTLNSKLPLITLDGLDPDKTYRLKEINRIDPKGRNFPAENQKMTGDFLMKVGVQANMRNATESRVVELVAE